MLQTVKPTPRPTGPTHGYRWKYRQPKCHHGFVLGLGICPHPGCEGASKRARLAHYSASYLRPKHMKAGRLKPGHYRCYICGRLLPDGSNPERDGPSAFFRASSKSNGHQSRCKKCDNRRRWLRRYRGTAQGLARVYC